MRWLAFIVGSSGLAPTRAVADLGLVVAPELSDARALYTGLNLIFETHRLFGESFPKNAQEHARTYGVRVGTHRLMEALDGIEVLPTAPGDEELHAEELTRSVLIARVLGEIVSSAEANRRVVLGRSSRQVLAAAAFSAYFLHMTPDHMARLTQFVEYTLNKLVELNLFLLLTADRGGPVQDLHSLSAIPATITCDWWDLYKPVAHIQRLLAPDAKFENIFENLRSPPRPSKHEAWRTGKKEQAAAGDVGGTGQSREPAFSQGALMCTTTTADGPPRMRRQTSS
ncbi:hypothetical protein GNI_034900 [Gregarina niphandrodes]|uniref:Uncharacterized protein n=1 Tax=Gregarina niphandrodes TaxID=110365 RepID=A0A023BB07_GRENI|nr:hypothetical protein GNI_034900 [Gregarina niphandrodes]EZG78548.1 hypothetical protein GNI_034900 [Gregarina niphandrodes]|eukprot:XP_011129254.1 hypothetical protein GNI_034900 [Gregarina niphandrodes]